MVVNIITTHNLSIQVTFSLHFIFNILIRHNLYDIIFNLDYCF